MRLKKKLFMAGLFHSHTNIRLTEKKQGQIFDGRSLTPRKKLMGQIPYLATTNGRTARMSTSSCTHVGGHEEYRIRRQL
jgi:hypothetical protein